MAVSNSFIEHAKDLFAPFGDIAVRKMFGGAGVYCDNLFFALLDDDVIYLKTDDRNRAEFERAGAAPFTFESERGAVTMGYYAAPGDFYDDPDETRRWTTLALDAARRAAKFKKKRAK